MMKKNILLLVSFLFSVLSFSANFVTVDENTFLDGKYVVYTALWCPHCRIEYEYIDKIYNEYKDNYNIVVFVSADNKKEEIEKYLDAKNFTFPIVYDTGNVYRDKVYNVEYFPTTLWHKNGSSPKKLEDFLFNLKRYYQINKKYIDKNTREKLKDVYVVDKNNNRINILDIEKKDALFVYFNKNETIFDNNLNKAIYLFDNNNMSMSDFLEYAKDRENVYYVDSVDLRQRFNMTENINILELRNSLFTNSFIPLEKYTIDK